MTRIVIASEQAIYLRGLTALVMAMPGMQLMGAARSGSEIVQLCPMVNPDVVLLDLMDKADMGQEIASQIHHVCPAAKIVLLVDGQDDIEMGTLSNDYLLYLFSRDVSEDEFRVALTQVERAPVKVGRELETYSLFKHQVESELENQGGAPALSSPPTRSEEYLTRELVMAGRIQSDILPEEPPYLPGWQVAARLLPARETSGDFYDFIPLTDHKVGILVADVTDKGMGAALFMALASTLIRTYAIRFPTLPALTMKAVNDRILSDTRGSMFVTAWFGILEPVTGRLTFANGGHPPGFLIGTQRGKETIEPMRPTGMALGVSEQAHWKQKAIRIGAGDLLMLYTDGITEAQNADGDFFGEERLLDAVLALSGRSAQDVLDGLVAEVRRFAGHAAQSDDIALIVLRREG